VHGPRQNWRREGFDRETLDAGEQEEQSAELDQPMA
jgi:hypothetical protein